MVLLKDGLSAKDKNQMIKKIEKVDGVKWVIGLNSLVGPNFPETMIPEDVKSMLKTDKYELQFVCSDYSSATDKVNAQLDEMQKIVKGYQKDAMVIGEAPLMKDLQDTTDIDLKTVNYISIAAIFIIILVNSNQSQYLSSLYRLLSLRLPATWRFHTIQIRHWHSLQVSLSVLSSLVRQSIMRYL